MKKSKILIPALSVASVGVVVAPLVTSCNNGVSYNINLQDWKYDTTITKKTEADEYNNTTAPAAYYTEAVKDDYKILRNDAISTFTEALSNEAETRIEYYEMYLNNLKYEKAGTDATPYYLLSVNCGMRVKGYDKDESGTEVMSEMSAAISVNSVAFSMQYVEPSGTTPYWGLVVDATTTKALTTDWSIKTEMYANERGTIMQLSEFADKAHPQMIDTLSINSFDSPYFEKVTFKE